ncbi:sugar ABC transporter permease [Georgenia sp. MJ173]|uniref:carbohydrate ABC transporter permease n=1 Tax=Georgenia sunbinii TaxID=3117728 RepID=UPI002F2607B6
MTALHPHDGGSETATATVGTSPAPKRRRRLSGRASAGLFLLPATAFVGILLLLPFVLTTVQSFTRDDGLRTPVFIGFDNYIALLGDAAVQQSLFNTLLWTFGAIILPASIGLGIAVLTNAMRMGKLFQLAFILPYALSGVATGTIWKFMLSTEGPANQLLDFLGMESITRGWLLNWPDNTIAMILVYAWQTSGVAVILFLVGLQSVPTETVEAARLDGASGATLFWRIVFPQLRSVTVVVIGMSLANGLRVFDLIWVLTGGGPGQISETLAVTMYRRTFVLGQYGVGAAVAVMLTIIVVLSSWLYLRTQMPKRD